MWSNRAGSNNIRYENYLSHSLNSFAIDYLATKYPDVTGYSAGLSLWYELMGSALAGILKLICVINRTSFLAIFFVGGSTVTQDIKVYNIHVNKDIIMCTAQMNTWIYHSIGWIHGGKYKNCAPNPIIGVFEDSRPCDWTVILTVTITASPRQEAARLLFERDLYNGFTSHGFYSEYVFQVKRLGGLCMKYSIPLSIFIYKPWLVGEGGLNTGVAYPVDFFPNKYKPRSNISRAASYVWATYPGDLR